ncbi:MAG: hypothetical protein MZV70_67025 [Desulfobacterales bacterium]|nr:hypothetical protein [Desulfobacterales bacterium]
MVELNVTNTTSAAIPVLCKKVETSMVPGTASLLLLGPLLRSERVRLSGPDHDRGQHHQRVWIFQDITSPSGFSGMSVIRYVFFDERNPLDLGPRQRQFPGLPAGHRRTLQKGTSVNAYPNPGLRQCDVLLFLAGGCLVDPGPQPSR